MPQNKRKQIIFRVVTVLAAVAIVSIALWIMVRRIGLVESYDFGAGAYYYADDPQLQNLADTESYSTSVPRWVHIVLFLAWGWLMWRLWIWVDNKSNRKNNGKDNPS